MASVNETHIFYIQAHGFLNHETYIVPNNTKIVFLAECNSLLNARSLNTEFLYYSKFGYQYENLKNGILPLNPSNTYPQMDLLCLSDIKKVYNSREIYTDLDLTFDYHYGAGEEFKVGVYKLPLINDTPENCDNNKMDYYFSPDDCNCKDKPCNFQLDTYNNYSESKFQTNSIDTDIDWYMKNSILNIQDLLALGGTLNKDGYIQINLSNIINALHTHYTGEIIIYVFACRANDTLFKKKIYNTLYAKSLEDLSVADPILILLDMISHIFNILKSDKPGYYNEYLHQIIMENIESIRGDLIDSRHIKACIYSIERFEEYYCKIRKRFARELKNKLDKIVSTECQKFSLKLKEMRIKSKIKTSIEPTYDFPSMYEHYLCEPPNRAFS